MKNKMNKDDDLISRAAAIDAFIDYIHKVDKTYSNGLLSDADCKDIAEKVLGENELPSAQPKIIRCKNCKCKYLVNMVWACPFGYPYGENFFCGYGS